jgi:glucose/arabinose dehydrogenase
MSRDTLLRMESMPENPMPIATVHPAKKHAPLIFLAVAAGILAVASFYYGNQQSSTSPQSTIATSTASTSALQPLQLKPATITTAGKTITLNIPSDYSINVAADGFKRVRFMAWSPDHRLFVGEMTSASDTNTGRVLILDGFNSGNHTFAASHVYLDNLRNPNSVAFYRDRNGEEWLYVALTDKLLRYRYTVGDNVPTAAPEQIATFPSGGREVMAGGWHLTRTLAFAGDALFVSIGSSCNSCEETEAMRAAIIKMNPDGSDSHVIASGLRNAVGITFAAGSLYATANESDHLGNDRPNDLVYKIQEGTNYAWPYCYQYNGAIYADTTQHWQTPYDCSKVPLAYAQLEPHSAPLGLEYFDNTFADPALRNSFLVAEHGSGKPSIGTGYMVSIVREGTWTPFINGFLLNGERQARPVDILRNDDHSFFITDDLNGALYYVAYRI